MKGKVLLFLSLFLLITMISIYSANPGDVVINEIAWDGTTASSTDEWIEFYNTTDTDIDISGWSIYGADTGNIINFSDADGSVNTVVPAHGYLIYANDNAVFSSGATVDIWDSTIGLNNTSPGNLILYDGPNGTGNIIDTADDNAGDWCAGNGTGEYTMERIDPCSSGDVCTNWGTNDGVTINGVDAGGNPIHGTPGQPNSVVNSTCSSGTDTTPPQVSSTAPSDGASGIPISDDIVINFNEEMDTTSSTGITFSPDPGGQTYTWSNNTTTLTITHNNFSYNTSYTITLDATIIKDVAGNPLDGNGDGTGGDNYSFSFTTANYGDGTGTAKIYPSKVLQNNYQTLNIVYTAEVDMSGNTISFTIPNAGTDWTVPQNGSPTGDGYVTVTGVGNTINVSIASVNSGSGEVIVSATNLDTNAQFIFTYGDISQGGNGAQCTTTGNYTFLIKSQGTGTLTPITSSPTVEVYAPQENKILISAILVDSTNGYDYIELYNPGPNDIDISNYWWGYYSSTRTDWTDPYYSYNFSGISHSGNSATTYDAKNLIIPSCGYLLLVMGSSSLNYDVTFYNAGVLSKTAGTFAIFPNDPQNYTDSATAYANRFDAVGWGVVTLKEGNSISSPLTDNEARRKSDASGIVAGEGNGYDTDNNSNDFIEQASSPKNSSSPKECPPWDYISPTVTSTTPIDNATQVSTTTNIIINFSEEMDTKSVMLALEVSPSFNYTSSWSNGNATLILTPAAPLSLDTLYQITVKDLATDKAGNALDGNNDGIPGGNYTFSFNTIDNVPPAAINDLTAKPYPTVGGIKITFTSPGDNDTTGTCVSYEIAYSTQPITNDTDFINANKYDISGITPQTAGNTESFVLTLLPAGTTFYISVKGVDESGNKSPFGNVASAVSGNYGVSKSPNVPLCESGQGNLSLTYDVGSTIFDGNDSMYVVVHSSFTTPNTTNISIDIDGTTISNSSYSITGSTITIPNITATNNIIIHFNNFTFPPNEGEYKFEMKILEDNSDLIDLDTPSFYVEKPIDMIFDPAEDPHSAPGHNQNIIVAIENDNGIKLYGAYITGMIIDSPVGATINPTSASTDENGHTTFVLTLSKDAGKHIVEFHCNDIIKYFIDTSFPGDFLSTPYPNPANKDTDTITFEVNIQEKNHLTLTILTMDARKVVDVADGDYNAGYHKFTFDLRDKYGRKLPSGIYYAILKADNFTKMVKFTIVR